MKWLLERRIRHLRRKLLEDGLSEREARSYLDAIYRFRGNPGHIDFDNPRTFSEKLNWLKLYWYDPLVCTCADKVAARDYIREKAGESLLVPLIAVYDRVEDVDFDALPDRFAMKVNWGSGQNIICTDKAKLDIGEARRKLATWMRPESNHYYDGLEWGYFGMRPRIIVERYLENAGDLPDYKFYFFDGKARFVSIIRGRYTSAPTLSYYDADYNQLPFTLKGWKFDTTGIPRPGTWERMLEIASPLAKPFPHVRVDFYCPAADEIKIGELTFWTQNGLTPHEPFEWDCRLGDMLQLPPKGEYRWGKVK